MLFGSDFPLITPDRWLARLREARHQATRSGRRSSRTTPPGCSGWRREVTPMRDAWHRLVAGPTRARMTPDRVAVDRGRPAADLRRARRPRRTLAHVLRPGGGAAATGSPTSGPTMPPSWRRCSPPASLGAVFVPLNTRLAAPELAYVARRLRRPGAAARRPSSATRCSAVADDPRVRLEHRVAAWGGSRATTAGRRPGRIGRRRRRPRRPVPDHVHVRHHRPSQGRHAHPRQHHVEQRQRADRHGPDPPTRSRWCPRRCSTSPR